MSFVRSADFSPDGQHLFVPSGHLEIGKNNVYTSYVFARSDMDRPIAILPSNSPTFIARCCPIAFELRSDSTEKFIDLPYRLVWAMVSNNAITLFDSQHSMPFAYMDNIHYNSITDLQWSSNGRVMLIASLEGYCSFILFGEDEIGIPLQPVLPVPPPSPSLPMSAAKKTPRRSKNIPPLDASNQRLTPSTTMINSSPSNTLLRYLRKTPTMETTEECVPVKKNKKRIQLITLTE